MTAPCTLYHNSFILLCLLFLDTTMPADVQAVAAHVEEVTRLLGEPRKVVLAASKAGGPLPEWPKVFRQAQV